MSLTSRTHAWCELPFAEIPSDLGAAASHRLPPFLLEASPSTPSSPQTERNPAPKLPLLAAPRCLRDRSINPGTSSPNAAHLPPRVRQLQPARSVLRGSHSCHKPGGRGCALRPLAKLQEAKQAREGFPGRREVGQLRGTTCRLRCGADAHQPWALKQVAATS